MADDKGAAEAVASADRARESLSQFVAKVLDQLSLSAWLPSAALVLSITFIVNLRAADGRLGDAVAAFGDYTLTDGLFLFAAVIVLTMVTQAFEFDAIRLLEGYWGPGRVPEVVADVSCAIQISRRERIYGRWRSAKRKAFKEAYFHLKVELARAPDVAVATERDLEILLADDSDSPMTMTVEERDAALAVRWTEYAPARWVRRMEDLDVAMREYPTDNRVLPTRLGNILRAYENTAFPNTQGLPLSSSVQRIFHKLPVHLQSEHDQFRTRLDLYCSMVFVTAIITAVAVWLLHVLGWWPYAAGAVAAGAVVSRLCYRAAIASARGYGSALVAIANFETA